MGRPPKLMQGPVSNPEQPDVNRARALHPQALRCRPKVVGDGPTPAVNVDGDIFPVVVRLDLRTDVPLIYLVAQASSLFSRSACGHGSFPALGGHRGLCVPHASPFRTCFRTWSVLSLTGVCDKERRSVQGRTALGHDLHYTIFSGQQGGWTPRPDRPWPQKLDHKLRCIMERTAKPVEGQNDGQETAAPKPGGAESRAVQLCQTMWEET